MPDAAIDASIATDRRRIQSMNFGYEAFKDETGKKTQDIDEAISSTTGNFRGQTIGTAFQNEIGCREILLELPTLKPGCCDGDVLLTVNIPKTTGSGDLKGTISNFAQWTSGGIWEK